MSSVFARIFKRYLGSASIKQAHVSLRPENKLKMKPVAVPQHSFSPFDIYAKEHRRSVRLRNPTATHYEVHQLLMADFHRLKVRDPKGYAALEDHTNEYNMLHSGVVSELSGQSRRERSDYEFRLWQVMDDEKRASIEEFCKRDRECTKMRAQRDALTQLQERYEFPTKKLRGHRVYMIERSNEFDEQKPAATYQERMKFLADVCTEWCEMEQEKRMVYEDKAHRINAAFVHARRKWALKMVASGRAKVAYRLVPDIEQYGWCPSYAAFSATVYDETAQSVEDAFNNQQLPLNDHVHAIQEAISERWSIMPVVAREQFERKVEVWTHQLAHIDQSYDDYLIAKSLGQLDHHHDHTEYDMLDNWFKQDPNYY